MKPKPPHIKANGPFAAKVHVTLPPKEQAEKLQRRLVH